jgi:hypothetical protein
MAGLVPATHAVRLHIRPGESWHRLASSWKTEGWPGVDGRDKPGQDVEVMLRVRPRLLANALRGKRSRRPIG